MVALALLCFGVAQTLGGSGFIAAFVGGLVAGKHLPGQDTMAATVAWTIMLSVLAHGLTAAVLRNAYISTASEEDAKQYKVNLSSERVRMSLAIIEGMQQGQARSLSRQLRLKFGDISDEVLRRVEFADASTLDEWSERILTANSIDDVMR